MCGFAVFDRWWAETHRSPVRPGTGRAARPWTRSSTLATPLGGDASTAAASRTPRPSPRASRTRCRRVRDVRERCAARFCSSRGSTFRGAEAPFAVTFEPGHVTGHVTGPSSCRDGSSARASAAHLDKNNNHRLILRQQKESCSEKASLLLEMCPNNQSLQTYKIKHMRSSL